jgi:hypothetical protein
VGVGGAGEKGGGVEKKIRQPRVLVPGARDLSAARTQVR